MHADPRSAAMSGESPGHHVPIAAAGQVEANAFELHANKIQQQLSGATSDMSRLNSEARGQSVQPQWLPRAQPHHNTMPNPAPAGFPVCFNEAEIAMANHLEATTAHMNDVWPTEWWDEFLDQGVGE
jgi:hypothetical protein